MGLALRQKYFHALQANAPQVIGQPVGTLLQIIRMLGLGTDAWKTEKLFKLRDKLCPASTSIAESAIRIQSSPQSYGNHLRNSSRAIPSVREWIVRIGDIIVGLVKPKQNGGKVEDRPIPISSRERASNRLCRSVWLPMLELAAVVATWEGRLSETARMGVGIDKFVLAF